MKTEEDNKYWIDREKEMSERIKFTWEQYNKISNLLITLTTGTIVIFLNNLLGKESLLNFLELPFSLRLLAVIGIISLLLGMITSIAWRMYSQIGMEKEVLGKREHVEKYLVETGMHESFTDHFKTWQESFPKKIWKILHTLSIILIALGWLVLGVFFSLLALSTTH
jgi:hypothetical protein